MLWKKLSLSGSNGIRTHNHLVCNKNSNSLAKWLNDRLRTKWLGSWIPLLSLNHSNAERWRSKNAFFRGRVRLCFFVAFNIIITHIFSEKFYRISSVRSEYMNVFFFNINDFHQFLVVFFYFLVTKKLIMSAYNRLRQHFFYYQSGQSNFFNNFIKLYWH